MPTESEGNSTNSGHLNSYGKWVLSHYLIKKRVLKQKLMVSSLRMTYNLVIIFNMYPPFWNITIFWIIATLIVLSHISVVFSRRNVSLPILSTVQLYIARECKCKCIAQTHIYTDSQKLKQVKAVIIICQTSYQSATME